MHFNACPTSQKLLQPTDAADDICILSGVCPHRRSNYGWASWSFKFDFDCSYPENVGTTADNVLTVGDNCYMRTHTVDDQNSSVQRRTERETMRVFQWDQHPPQRSWQGNSRYRKKNSSVWISLQDTQSPNKLENISKQDQPTDSDNMLSILNGEYSDPTNPAGTVLHQRIPPNQMMDSITEMGIFSIWCCTVLTSKCQASTISKQSSGTTGVWMKFKIAERSQRQILRSAGRFHSMLHPPARSNSAPSIVVRHWHPGETTESTKY